LNVTSVHDQSTRVCVCVQHTDGGELCCLNGTHTHSNPTSPIFGSCAGLAPT
jgi:hypothetical protein